VLAAIKPGEGGGGGRGVGLGCEGLVGDRREKGDSPPAVKHYGKTCVAKREVKKDKRFTRRCLWGGEGGLEIALNAPLAHAMSCFQGERASILGGYD